MLLCTAVGVRRVWQAQLAEESVMHRVAWIKRCDLLQSGGILLRALTCLLESDCVFCRGSTHLLKLHEAERLVHLEAIVSGFRVLNIDFVNV